jgi:hypothetical protein
MGNKESEEACGRPSMHQVRVSIPPVTVRSARIRAPSDRGGKEDGFVG